jgi:hypothetical protein
MTCLSELRSPADRLIAVFASGSFRPKLAANFVIAVFDPKRALFTNSWVQLTERSRRPGSVAAVRVGAYEKALAAMQEFLAQSEVGEQLVKAGQHPPT